MLFFRWSDRIGRIIIFLNLLMIWIMLLLYLHNKNFVDRILAKCTGSSYPAINSSDLAEILIEIPKPAEQQKIASCLSTLDALITAQTEKTEALKTHKKGLMQGLFPKV